MSNIQLQFPHRYYLRLKKRVLNDMRDQGMKISKRSPSHINIQGVLGSFFEKARVKGTLPEYIIFNTLGSTTISRAFSSKNDGRGVDIEILDQISMYLEGSFKTSFFEYLDIKTTNELEQYVCREHKERFGDLRETVFKLYSFPDELPKRLKRIVKGIKINHTSNKKVDLSTTKKGQVMIVLGHDKDGKEKGLHVKVDGGNYVITKFKAIVFFLLFFPKNIWETLKYLFNRITQGILFPSSTKFYSKYFVTIALTIGGGIFFLINKDYKKDTKSLIQAKTIVYTDSFPKKGVISLEGLLDVGCYTLSKYNNAFIGVDTFENDLDIYLTKKGALHIYLPQKTTVDLDNLKDVYIYPTQSGVFRQLLNSKKVITVKVPSSPTKTSRGIIDAKISSFWGAGVLAKDMEDFIEGSIRIQGRKMFSLFRTNEFYDGKLILKKNDQKDYIQKGLFQRMGLKVNLTKMKICEGVYIMFLPIYKDAKMIFALPIELTVK